MLTHLILPLDVANSDRRQGHRTSAVWRHFHAARPWRPASRLRSPAPPAARCVQLPPPATPPALFPPLPAAPPLWLPPLQAPPPGLSARPHIEHLRWRTRIAERYCLPYAASAASRAVSTFAPQRLLSGCHLRMRLRPACIAMRRAFEIGLDREKHDTLSTEHLKLDWTRKTMALSQAVVCSHETAYLAVRSPWPGFDAAPLPCRCIAARWGSDAREIISET